MARESIDMNMSRESVSMDDISSRLAHKKYVTLHLRETRIPLQRR